MNLHAKSSVIGSLLLIASFILTTSPMCQCQDAVRANRTSLPIDHDHDGTNPEGGGVRINRHVRLEADNSSNRDDNDSKILSRPPVFVDDQSTDIEQVFASYLKLNCSVKSFKSRPAVKWMKDNKRVDLKNGRFRLQDNDLSLIIENSRVEDSGLYSCHLKFDKNKEISKQFQVKFVSQPFSPPALRPDMPGNLTVLRGSNLTLHCEVINLKDCYPVEILWLQHYKNATKFKDENGAPLGKMLQDCAHVGLCVDFYNKSISWTVPDEEVFMLHLFNLQESGWYTCIVGSPHGEAKTSGYITVVDEFPVDPTLLEERQHSKVVVVASAGIIAFVLVAAVIFLFGAIVFKQRASKEEARRKATDEYAKSVIVWTKHVIVRMESENHQQCTEGSEKSPLIAPIVTIERRPFSPPVGGSGKNHSGAVNYSAVEYIYEPDSEWEFDRNKLILGEVLGEGAFGRVVSATANGTTVAIKMLKEGHTDADVEDLVKETEIMKMICHKTPCDNIINLLGVCTQPPGKPFYVIVEYARFGNLKDYLIARRPTGTSLNNYAYMIPDQATRQVIDHRPDFIPIPQSASNRGAETLQLCDLLNMAHQVAKGMQFLAVKRCVHRDLAARNVLVCDNNIYKIADFGMARGVSQADYYRKSSAGKVPLKWMAPEAIFERIYTTQSDIWSYGILLWEIMTFGENPYHNINTDVLLEILRCGNRLQKPPGCPESVYNLMQRTWNFDPEERPSWITIVEETHKMFAKAQPNSYLFLSSNDAEEYDENCTETSFLTRTSSYMLPPTPPPTPGDPVATVNMSYNDSNMICHKN